MVLTAHGAKDTAGLANNPVVFRLLTKPFELEMLIEVLKSAAAKKRGRSLRS
jgi:DNA-binding NtrC family response regulator